MGNYSETELGLGLCTCNKCNNFRQPHPAAPHMLRWYQPAYLCESNKAVIGLKKDHHSVYIETTCVSSDVRSYTWDAKQLHCMPHTMIMTCMTLLMSRWTTSIELKPGSKRTYACISLSRPSKRRRRENLSDVRWPLHRHDVRESLRDALFIHSRHRNVLSFVSMPEI